MKPKPVCILISIVMLLHACAKPEPCETVAPTAVSQAPLPASPVIYTPPTHTSESRSILVDASKDGGVWWFPQGPSTGYNASEPHQGKLLADHLRKLGYQVDELGRGTLITWELLSKYDKVIRAGGCGTYNASELLAYDSFLLRPSGLLLMQDHLQNCSNDALSLRLNLPFTGAVSGTVTRFAPHAITSGVTSLSYVAGSVITHPDINKLTVLGTLRTGATGEDPNGSAVMGIQHHPTSRVFFIGEMNVLEQVPQPFTDNLLKWLFQ